MQLILNKSYVVEKLANTQDKSGEVQQQNIAHDVKQENEKRASSVNETKESEGKSIDSKEKKRREQEERKRRERKKEIAKRLSRDSGHIIDLEA